MCTIRFIPATASSRRPLLTDAIIYDSDHDDDEPTAARTRRQNKKAWYQQVGELKHPTYLKVYADPVYDELGRLPSVAS